MADGNKLVMTVMQEAPTGWWPLHVVAEQFFARQGTQVARTKSLVLKPIPKGFADQAQARRDLIRHYHAQVRLHNQAQHVHLGAHGFAMERKFADFATRSLPERVAEADKAGVMLRRFVQAGQLLVSAQQMEANQPELAKNLHRQVAGRIKRIRTQLFPPEGTAPTMTTPFQAITVLTIVGTEVPGLSALHRRLIINALLPKPL